MRMHIVEATPLILTTKMGPPVQNPQLQVPQLFNLPQFSSICLNSAHLEKLPGIRTLFLEIAEDDNLTGLQTITKKAFHILISNRTTKHHADAHN